MRQTARRPAFPPRRAETVRAEIARHLEQWNIGFGDLAICGGACGADILFGEECVRRGAQLRLLLAQAVGDFIRDSVQHAGCDWAPRGTKSRRATALAAPPILNPKCAASEA